MAALDLHNKCSTTAAGAKVKAKSKEEGCGRRRSRLTQPCQKQKPAKLLRKYIDWLKIHQMRTQESKARLAQLPEISLH